MQFVRNCTFFYIKQKLFNFLHRLNMSFLSLLKCNKLWFVCYHCQCISAVHSNIYILVYIVIKYRYLLHERNSISIKSKQKYIYKSLRIKLGADVFFGFLNQHLCLSYKFTLVLKCEYDLDLVITMSHSHSRYLWRSIK